MKCQTYRNQAIHASSRFNKAYQGTELVQIWRIHISLDDDTGSVPEFERSGPNLPTPRNVGGIVIESVVIDQLEVLKIEINIKHKLLTVSQSLEKSSTDEL